MSKIKVDQLETLDGSATVNVADLASAGSGVTDHGALAGLADDDHPQYLNESRGDARYSQLGHGHAVSDVAGLQTALDGKQAALVSGTNVATTNAPGSGQSFTYTVRKKGSNTTLTGGITGTNSFQAGVWCGVNPIQMSKGDSFSMQLVTSAGASSSRHQGHILFLPE